MMTCYKEYCGKPAHKKATAADHAGNRQKKRANELEPQQQPFCDCKSTRRAFKKAEMFLMKNTQKDQSKKTII
ncbi:unnamed protein product [Angiostrongylus costaricensis]|uniref:C2H2-type domain-containing protein n=1 Tax=Angiostrongylus costaricensis TaxID=334426 RepID=A0A0R3PD66_ANGCS|nr:unnamed protein product [Angiostrongylus costaricensis]